MKDAYGRTIDYMRVSVTDRCNLRCKYCMPNGFQEGLAHEDILTYEEILRLCAIVAAAGVKKIKVTGGEPLVRLGCVDFLRRLSGIPGIEDVTITTNGVELKQYLPDLKDMGIGGINVSLDTLRPERFAAITGRDRFAGVWEAVMEAVSLGVRVKLNCVPMAGFNDDEFLDFARLAADYPLDVRFIEMMPIGFGAGFAPVSGSGILEFLNREFMPLTAVRESRGNGPARYVRGQGMKGCIGFIEAVNHKFCVTCNRVRLTADGQLKLCLYYDIGVDLREPLRSGCADEEILRLFQEGLGLKPMEHHFYSGDSKADKKKMSQIGG